MTVLRLLLILHKGAKKFPITNLYRYLMTLPVNGVGTRFHSSQTKKPQAFMSTTHSFQGAGRTAYVDNLRLLCKGKLICAHTNVGLLASYPSA